MTGKVGEKIYELDKDCWQVIVSYSPEKYHNLLRTSKEMQNCIQTETNRKIVRLLFEFGLPSIPKELDMKSYEEVTLILKKDQEDLIFKYTCPPKLLKLIGAPEFAYLPECKIEDHYLDKHDLLTIYTPTFNLNNPKFRIFKSKEEVLIGDGKIKERNFICVQKEYSTGFTMYALDVFCSAEKEWSKCEKEFLEEPKFTDIIEKIRVLNPEELRIATDFLLLKFQIKNNQFSPNDIITKFNSIFTEDDIKKKQFYSEKKQKDNLEKDNAEREKVYLQFEQDIKAIKKEKNSDRESKIDSEEMLEYTSR